MSAIMHAGSMRERHVVIVGFQGVQSLDVVGPFEVFGGAGRAAEALGRPGGYRVTLASSDGGSVRAESGLGLEAGPLPEPGERIDTLLLPGGGRAEAARRDPYLMSWIRASAP